MISKINKLVGALLIVGAALYIVLLNREPITLSLSRSWSVTSTGGVILIGVFLSGVVVTSLVAAFFGVRSYLREQRLLGREKSIKLFYQGVVLARNSTAAHEFVKARERWEQILRRDPTDIIARVELSKVVEALGDPREALHIVDQARAKEPHNTEVLFRAAELNLALGNKTAAIDNLSLLLIHAPNRRAAALARDLSLELGRPEQALKYQSQLEELGANRDEELSNRARIELALALRASEPTEGDLTSRLKALAKRFPLSAPILERLAETYQSQGAIEEATHYLLRAGAATKEIRFWRKTVLLWLAARQPDRALAAARSATKELAGSTRLDAEILLVQTLLALNMLGDAKRNLEQLPTIARQTEVQLSREQAGTCVALKGICYARLGEVRGSAELWSSLGAHEIQPSMEIGVEAQETTGPSPVSGESSIKPSPVLSTP